ncbi:MAG TPA: PKD domain-containing protein [Conexibacter sp.]|jgi:hypothetical protein|nr:PKD domain-containing protein [Conexibacter sp.]
MIRCVGRAVLATILVALLAAPAGAATGFVADETLSTASTNVPALAMAPNGYAVVAWVERPAGAKVVRVSVRPPGGSWSAPQTLPTTLEGVSSLGVAIASSGAAAVAWQETMSPSTFEIGVATRPAGGTFGAPEALTDGNQTLSPAIGIDATGRVTLLYFPSPDTAVREFAAGSSVLAAAPEVISPGCSAFNQHLAVAPSGDAVAGYDCGGAVFALRRAGRWAVSPKVSDNFPGGTCTSPTDYLPASVAIDTAGNPVGVLESVFQQRSDLGIGGCQTMSMTVDAKLVLPLAGLMTSVPGPPAVSEFAFGFGIIFTPVIAPSAAISPAGIVLSWGDSRDSQRAVPKVRFYAPDGSGGSAAETVGSTPAIGSVAPVLAVAADGRALMAWAQVSRFGEDAVVLVAERLPGGSFGDPVPVNAPGGPSFAPMVATSNAGDGAVAWIRNETVPYELHVRGFDASAPTLSGVAIPPTATAGVPASFAASAFDLWGPATIRWGFGDGGTATGAAPTHAYASAGTFTATMTATDAVGNAASRSGTVQVQAASSSSPPVGAPRLTNASLTHRRFRVGRSRTPLRGVLAGRRASRAPVGTTFRFTLDRAANVRIGFARQTRGLRNRDGDCVRPSRRLAGHRRCKLFVPDGTLVRSAPQGAIRVPFSGRVGRRALRPGSYRAGLTAAIGGRSAKPTVLTFRIVR